MLQVKRKNTRVSDQESSFKFQLVTNLVFLQLNVSQKENSDKKGGTCLECSEHQFKKFISLIHRSYENLPLPCKLGSKN